MSRKGRRYSISFKGQELIGFKIKALDRTRHILVVTEPNPKGFHLTDVIDGSMIKPHTSGRTGRHLPEWDTLKFSTELRDYLTRHILPYHHNRVALVPSGEFLSIIENYRKKFDAGGIVSLESITRELTLDDMKYFSTVRIRDLAKKHPYYGFTVRKGGLNYVFPVDKKKALFIPLSYIERMFKEILKGVGALSYFEDVMKSKRAEFRRRLREIAERPDEKVDVG